MKFIVYYQVNDGMHKAGDKVSEHRSWLEAYHKAASYWAWAFVEMAGTTEN